MRFSTRFDARVNPRASIRVLTRIYPRVSRVFMRVLSAHFYARLCRTIRAVHFVLLCSCRNAMRPPYGNVQASSLRDIA
jgi:hypothetical protein